MHRRIALEPAAPCEPERTQVGVPARLHEQVREGRMRFVGGLRGQHDFEVRGQLDDRRRSFARVFERDLAHLDIFLRRHPDAQACRHIGTDRLEGGGMRLPLAAVLGARVGRGVLRQRVPARAVLTFANDAQEHERAMLAAQRVVAPARNSQPHPVRGPRAVGAQQHRRAAVGQQGHRLQCARARLQRAGRQRRRVGELVEPGIDPRRWWPQRLDHRRHRLVQQRRDRTDLRVAHEPAPRRAVVQRVRQRQQRHALVVRHEGGDAALRGPALLARRGVVERLDETEAVARAVLFEPAQVGPGLPRCDLQRQHRRIRRDHTLVLRRAPQRQRRGALRPVLVGQRDIALGMGRLGHAPRQLPGAALLALHRHRDLRGRVEQAAHRLIDQQRRHQVLEHRARPRLHADVGALCKRRPLQPCPVPGRQVALGNGHQAGQPRFRAQHVVVVDVQALFAARVVEQRADVQQLAPRVVQPAVVRRPGQLLGAFRQRCAVIDERLVVECERAQGAQVVQQLPQRLLGGLRRLAVERGLVVERGQAALHLVDVGCDGIEGGQQTGPPCGAELGLAALQRGLRGLVAGRVVEAAVTLATQGTGHRHQRRAQVAAVDGGQVGRRQHRQRLRVVPVEEVAAVAGQSVQRVQRRTDALQHLLAADETEAPRAQHRQQVHADVGRRGSRGRLRMRQPLVVVRRQVVMLGRHHVLEVAPGLARHVVQIGAHLGRQRTFLHRRPRLRRAPGQQRRQRPDGAQHQARHEAGQRRLRRHEQQRHRQQDRQCADLAVAPPQRASVARGRGFGGGGRGPGQQTAVGDGLAHQGAHDGVDRQQRLLQQLRDLPRRAAERAAERVAGMAGQRRQRDAVVGAGHGGQRADQRPDAQGDGDQQQRSRQARRADGSTRHQQAHRRRCDQRAAHVVGHLPQVQAAHRPVPRVQHEGQQLPVAAHPAVQARRGHVRVHGGAFDHRHIADRGATQQRAFEQIVAQHLGARQAARQDRVRGLHMDQAFAGEAALFEQVLIDLGTGGAVRIEPGLTDRQRVKPGRAAGPRQGQRDTRLQHAVAFDDAPRVCIDARRVGRVRSDADQRAQGARWQQRVAVEDDEVRRRRDRPRQARRTRHGDEGVGRAARQQIDQLLDLAALPLPAHPAALAVAPLALPVQQHEARRAVGQRAVALVQDPQRVFGMRQQRGIRRHDLRRRIDQVGQQGVLRPRFVAGQVLALDLRGQRVDRGRVVEQAGHGDQHALARWNAGLEGQARQGLRCDPFGDQAVDRRDRDLRGRQQHQRPQPERCIGAQRQRSDGGRGRGQARQVQRQACAPPGIARGEFSRQCHAERLGQRAPARAFEPIAWSAARRSAAGADGRGPRRGRCRAGLCLRQHRARDTHLVDAAALAPALDRMQRAVLRRFVLGGEGRQLAQHLRQAAALADPDAPVELRHRTQGAHRLRHVGVVRRFGRLLGVPCGGRVGKVLGEPDTARVVDGELAPAQVKLQQEGALGAAALQRAECGAHGRQVGGARFAGHPVGE